MPMYGECDAHPSGYGQGNNGFSGAPMWKIKQQTAHHQAMVQAAQRAFMDGKEAEEAERRRVALELERGHKLLVDAVVLSAGILVAPAQEKDKTGVTPPQVVKLVRNVIVRDLRKVAGTLNIPLPKAGLFADTGQRALFALFDGQSDDAPDPRVAEACCRQLPVLLLRNLAPLPPQNCVAAFVKAAMLKTFEDLGKELSAAGLSTKCAASVVLIVGPWLFSAVLGGCTAILFQGGQRPSAARGPSGPSGYIPIHLAGASRLLTPQTFGMPDVTGHELALNDGDPFIVLAGPPVSEVVPVAELLDASVAFLQRPRAACGEIAARAVERLKAKTGESEDHLPDCAVISAFFRRPELESKRTDTAPPAKKPKTDEKAFESVRIRHIVVRHKDCKHPVDPVRNKPVQRSLEEAEQVLRSVLMELEKDGCHRGDSKWAATSTGRIMKVTRETSECKSALKGGSQCGDLGWLGKKELDKMGKEIFVENVKSLPIGEWSDIMHTEQGAHIMMRIA